MSFIEITETSLDYNQGKSVFAHCKDPKCSLKAKKVKRDQILIATAHSYRWSQTRIVCKAFFHIFKNKLVAPISWFCLKATVTNYTGLSFWTDEISPPKTSVRLFTSFLTSHLQWNLILKIICSALRTSSNAHKKQRLQLDRFSNARANFSCQSHSMLVCEGFGHIFNNNLAAPIRRFCLQLFVKTHCVVSMHMTKQKIKRHTHHSYIYYVFFTQTPTAFQSNLSSWQVALTSDIF